jgi:hypothetical protein
MLKPRTPLHRLAKTSVWLALFPTGCSVHGSWQAGSGTTSNEEVHEEHAAPAPAHRHAHGRDRPDCDGADAERCAEAKRRADERVAQIDRETQERVAQAERDAAEDERKAEEEAARAREAARAEEEQRAKAAAESQAAASGTQGTRELRRKQTSTFIHKSGDAEAAPADNDLEGAIRRRNGEIDQTVVVRKTEIRKKLDRTKADILVAAERKRSEVQAQLKEDATKQP